jgi:putative transposase
VLNNQDKLVTEYAMQCCHAKQMGATYFFTLVTHDRKPILTIPENIEGLREAFRHVMRKHLIDIEGIVILPDHLHCLWRLPERNNDFSIRWSKIKRNFIIVLLGTLRFAQQDYIGDSKIPGNSIFPHNFSCLHLNYFAINVSLLFNYSKIIYDF